MKIEVCNHICCNCSQSYDSLETTSYNTLYTQMCRQCLDAKVLDLEDKLNKLYDFFKTTSNLRVK